MSQVLSSTEQDDICQKCMKSYEPGAYTRILTDCGHTFCIECLLNGLHFCTTFNGIIPTCMICNTDMMNAWRYIPDK
jgi:hypothetical protein